MDMLRGIFSGKEKQWKRKGKGHVLGCSAPPSSTVQQGTSPQRVPLPNTPSLQPNRTAASSRAESVANAHHVLSAQPARAQTHSSSQGGKKEQSTEPPSKEGTTSSSKTWQEQDYKSEQPGVRERETTWRHAWPWHVKLSSPKVQQAMEVPGFSEFLVAAGFVLCYKNLEGEAGDLDPVDPDRHYAVLPEDASLRALSVGGAEVKRAMQGMGIHEETPNSQQAAALTQQYRQHQGPGVSGAVRQAVTMEAQQNTASNRSAAAVSRPLPQTDRFDESRQQQQQQQQVDRATKVILPVTPDAEVPEWFFERTAAEIKNEYLRLTQARKQSEVLTTKHMREQAAAVPNTSKEHMHRQTTLRVRFPEGVVLQGVFHVNEACTVVHEWLCSSLRFPGSCYELITPSARKALPSKGLVGEMPELVPAAVLNFRVVDQDPQVANKPFLKDELLQMTQTE